MARGCEATLCAKCSKDSPDSIAAACLQPNRRLWLSRGREELFGFPPYLVLAELRT
jgi:hypothetical protein